MSTKTMIGDGTEFDDESSEFKFDISYPDSLDTKIRETRASLDCWKEIIIPLYKFLIWDKQWCPLAIIGVSTSIFMFIWLSQTSLLTIFSVGGLIAILCDYLVPTILCSIIKSDRWTPEKEAIFEGICGDIIIYKTQMEVSCTTYYRMRTTNPKMYFAFTTMSLALLAWIGNTFNNLFLMYLLTTFILLYPGIQHNGFSIKLKQIIAKFLKDYVNPRFQNVKKHN